MHYTSVPNILKVLNPLFLNELRAKLEEAGDNPRMRLNLRKRMAKIRVFDPACGSGNFLVIAYKQMREIEAEANRRRGETDRGSDIPLTRECFERAMMEGAKTIRVHKVIPRNSSDRWPPKEVHPVRRFRFGSRPGWLAVDCARRIRTDIGRGSLGSGTPCPQH